MKTIIALLLFCVVLAGCVSSFDTRQYDPAKDATGIHNGITYYETKMFVVRYVFTQATNKDGELLGDSKDLEKPCTLAVQKDDIQYLPDVSKKMVISQNVTPFAASQLQVGFNANGTLASINVVSTPQTAQLLSTLETAAKDKVLGLALKAKVLACNSAPIIQSVTPISSIDDFKSLGK